MNKANTVDTSTEAVERVAKEISGLASREAVSMIQGWEDAFELYLKAADQLSALAAERDTLANQVEDCARECAKLAEEIQRLQAQLAETRASLYALEKGVWRDGYPDKISGSEWFIALLEDNRRVVLRSLPEEHSYDYTTADDTYLAAWKIKRWMQFPDANFIAPDTIVHTTVERIEQIKEEARNAALEEAAEVVARIKKPTIPPMFMGQTRAEAYDMGQHNACESKAELIRTLKSEPAPHPDCPECSGSGMRDSGGVQPWGDHIDAPCDCENAPAPRQSVQKAADNLAKGLRSAGYFIPSSIIFDVMVQKKSAS
ncbi:Chaperone clpB [Ruegeria sp. TM1040]|uniref:hypothetical protein n=1 Tax=Ruegeria sp. (strain TM1040) TaxID=292414 RepID=UPI000046265C|nr:hypothetical protein [Ruegeria sp. TM1040]ABF63511.1 Chaperone clpB [Ruegeria sp. TM1040]